MNIISQKVNIKYKKQGNTKFSYIWDWICFMDTTADITEIVLT